MDRAGLSAPDDEDSFGHVVGRLRAEEAILSVRRVAERRERLSVLRGVAQPILLSDDRGAMVTAYLPGGLGYCATSDLSLQGLQEAADRALQWARACQRRGVFSSVDWPMPAAPRPAAMVPVALVSINDDGVAAPGWPARPVLIDLLSREEAALRGDPRIVNACASLGRSRVDQWFYLDGELIQAERHWYVEPNLEATAADGARTQTRTLGGQYNGFCQQGGFEVFERSGFVGAGARIADEALELLGAPNCPSGAMDLLLAPDQMMLQIHESIGHPLELDRILGDERNFAGTSFVTPSMFGHYQYGSPALNVTFDPTVAGQYASYGADDDGMRAEREWLIREGILQRPLGSALSLARARAQGLDLRGVANARACGWHRPAIDRMGNINVEPGEHTLERMVSSVEFGVLMKTNVSWSIDDSRNKFQFGCEWGRLIEKGRLTRVVRNPNYRGISATFWRSLAMVGDESTRELMGTPFCGKGEPGQVIRVGHAAPAALFRGVDVFGGAL